MSNIVCGKDRSGDVKRAIGSAALTVTDSNVAALYPELAAGAYVIPAGEKNKNLDTLTGILSEMHTRGLKRGDTVAALGGGVVGDMTGFAAAVYMRGIDWISIPTTLLAMVDSGLGGKTAVDFAGVKNLIGAFHESRDFIVNAAFLRTLPPREWICGYGELIKTCVLDSAAYPELMKNLDAVKNNDIDGIFPLIERCVAIKNAVVREDLTEKGLRRILNVGHTVGHALESAGGYELSHGEYVIMGMMTEATMCKDIMDGGFYAEFMRLLKGFAAVPAASAAEVVKYAVSDKKNVGDTITVMIPRRPGDIVDVKLTVDDFCAKYSAAVKELQDK